MIRLLPLLGIGIPCVLRASLQVPSEGLHATPLVIDTPAPDRSKPLYPQADDATLLVAFDTQFANVIVAPPGAPNTKYGAKRVEAVTRHPSRGRGNGN